MPITPLTAAQLRLTVDPVTLGFADTSELVDQPLAWIGQERAENAAAFGLGMEQTDYNLFVLGEVGSGRSSLLKRAMEAAAAHRPTPPDLCYLHNFDAPEHPRALRLLPGQGRVLRQGMAQMVKVLLTEIPQRLDGPDCKVESERIVEAYQEEESRAYAELETFGEGRHFAMHREAGRILYTVRDPQGHPLNEDEVLALPKERRGEISLAEQALLAEINRFFEQTRPQEQLMNEALAELRRQVVKPLLERELETLRSMVEPAPHHSFQLGPHLEQVMAEILDQLELFKAAEGEDDRRQELLAKMLARFRVNLVVDNDGLQGAPVIIEDNPLFRPLFGSIEYQTENDALVTDFSRIRAGSLIRANGGFLLLHLRDLMADSLVWEKFRRFLRSGCLQIEEPGTAFAPIAALSLEPEAVAVEVKIVLIGSRHLYYEIQETDPEFARHFRVKVDFADSFIADDHTRRAAAILVAHSCQDLGLPHFSAAAIARLHEQAHREAEDKSRQSALFGRTEALIMESATLCRARGGRLVAANDIDTALAAHRRRHDYPEQRMREAMVEGDVLISLDGERVGQQNGLTVFDLGDHRFGFPVRVTARTYAGEEGLISIEREVEMSGPLHDKGVLILQNFLAALFARNAPLALTGALVFEQEYHGIEGDSASCAELYALLSSLSGLPLRQGIAVTGALNQHGEVLPIGGVNEKIEGYFDICAAAGLSGRQGVLIPERNRRHLMLGQRVVDAVAQGRFHVHTITEVTEGLELLTGLVAGSSNRNGVYPRDSVLGRAQKTLQAYRRACQASEASSGSKIEDRP